MDFESIYREFSSKIFRVCLSYLNDPDKAKDLTQETFIAVWLNLDSFKQKSNIGTWIYRIACNKCLRQIDNDLKVTKVDLPTQLKEAPFDHTQEQRLVFLRKCIADLPELERIIISLFLEDVPQEKIGEITGLSHSNVRVKVHRIKEKLIKKFADNGQL